ncbi:MAG TPA: hypothetical protein PLW86_17395 [Rhodocyclaceae bacterium]|nr:hypothetical protein [Rhodocyclaceae bacterium]
MDTSIQLWKPAGDVYFTLEPNMHRPISVAELEAIVTNQLAECTASQQAAFAQYRVPFYQLPLHRFGQIETAFVVAHLPNGILYFEDVEEGFEISSLGKDGALPDQGCSQFELRHVLTQSGL